MVKDDSGYANGFRFWMIAIVLIILFASKIRFFKSMESLNDPILASKRGDSVASLDDTRAHVRERVNPYASY